MSNIQEMNVSTYGWVAELVQQRLDSDPIARFAGVRAVQVLKDLDQFVADPMDFVTYYLGELEDNYNNYAEDVDSFEKAVEIYMACPEFIDLQASPSYINMWGNLSDAIVFAVAESVRFAVRIAFSVWNEVEEASPKTPLTAS